MKFEHTEVFGWEAALRGMRNPLASWKRIDSSFDGEGNFFIGPNDMDLAKRLIVAGSEHRKFLRMIHVQVDITAPMYFWSEYDTYKVSTTANSTSKMHKLASTPITIECFETDDWDMKYDNVIPEDLIDKLESLRQKYNETKNFHYWKELVRWLPESWLQTRTVDLNYEIIKNMYNQRKAHKLTEWRDSFCKWVESLPYAQELII